MLTKSDIYNIQKIVMGTKPHTDLARSPYYSGDLMDLIDLMARKIWSECGENLSDFLMPPAPLEMQDANAVHENLVLQSDLSLQEPTIEQEKEMLDFRKVLL